MRTSNGIEFVLLDRIYLQDIERKAPEQVPVCLEQLERCGYIIAFPYVDRYLGCYEPISRTSTLDDIYFYLENQIN